ncbi:PREDICTED: pyridoxal phosphate phosphatase [Bactrocera latifrons]|uniref:pyridoxal phosphate phosphatase n=1 Tax=Bactrocera latifrons TaxID=174628 RepID=UPI0008DE7CB9|nr:PREDICTED: pyridoxal phosphate phosphatase [Bactrocera latifrons]
MSNKGETTRKTSRHILKLNGKEKREFLNSFDRIFSDVDGVVWARDEYIPRAAEGFKALANAGKKFSFVTNNGVRTMSEYAQRFKELGIEFNASEFVYPAKSVVQYLDSIRFKGLIYVMATDNFKNSLREAGYEFIFGPLKIIKETYSELANHIFSDEPVRAVILDVDFNMSSLNLIRAHLFLRHPDCILILGASDKFLPFAKGVDIIGPCSFAQIIADSSKKRLITLGKPGIELAEMLLKNFDIKERKRVLMIGDMLEQDIGFGSQCGFQTLLVLSGGCNLEKMQAETDPVHIPDYYADSMGDFNEFLKDFKKAEV